MAVKGAYKVGKIRIDNTEKSLGDYGHRIDRLKISRHTCQYSLLFHIEQLVDSRSVVLVNLIQKPRVLAVFIKPTENKVREG
jgi:hypothetical protein